MQGLEGMEISGNIFANGSVRAAAGFESGGARGGKGVVDNQELGDFAEGKENR